MVSLVCFCIMSLFHLHHFALPTTKALVSFLKGYEGRKPQQRLLTKTSSLHVFKLRPKDLKVRPDFTRMETCVCIIQKQRTQELHACPRNYHMRLTSTPSTPPLPAWSSFESLMLQGPSLADDQCPADMLSLFLRCWCWFLNL